MAPIRNNIPIKNPEIVPKLSKILDLIFMKTNSQLKNSVKDRIEKKRDPYCSINKFRRAAPFGKRCASLINECILSHRFEEAAKLLWILCQDRSCFDLVLYKGLMVVLENIVSDNKIQTVKYFLSNMKKLYLTNKLEIQLEYMLYALKNDVHGVEESFYVDISKYSRLKELLLLLLVFKGKKERTRPIKIIPQIKHLYSAYCALINYIEWAKISHGQESSKVNQSIPFHVIHIFKNLISNPGMWDIFVLKLIEMLEYYEKYDELEEVLKKYIESNPQHINAYIYICVHLHKHNSDQRTFIHYAKILADLCPSDDRVLLLVQKLGELGKNLKKSLKLIFNFLDYPVNGNKFLAWQLLSSLLQNAKSSKKSSSMTVVESSWNIRKTVWGIMYFKTSSTCIDTFELLLCKVRVISILEPGHEYITHVQEKFPCINKELQMPSEIFSQPSSEDFRTFYEINDDIRTRE